jgi:hypothetical protein
MQLKLAVRRVVSRKVQSIFVELHAVIGGDDDHCVVEEFPTFQIVEHATEQFIDEPDAGEIAGTLHDLGRGTGRYRHHRGVVVGGLESHRGVVVEESEEGA